MNPQKSSNLPHNSDEEVQNSYQVSPKACPEYSVSSCVISNTLEEQQKDGGYNSRQCFQVEIRQGHLDKGLYTLVTEEMMTLQMIKLQSSPRLSKIIPLNSLQNSLLYQMSMRIMIRQKVKHSLIGLILSSLVRIVFTNKYMHEKNIRPPK